MKIILFQLGACSSKRLAVGSSVPRARHELSQLLPSHHHHRDFHPSFSRIAQLLPRADRETDRALEDEQLERSPSQRLLIRPYQVRSRFAVFRSRSDERCRNPLPLGPFHECPQRLSASNVPQLTVIDVRLFKCSK